MLYWLKNILRNFIVIWFKALRTHAVNVLFSFFTARGRYLCWLTISTQRSDQLSYTYIYSQYFSTHMIYNKPLKSCRYTTEFWNNKETNVPNPNTKLTLDGIAYFLYLFVGHIALQLLASYLSLSFIYFDLSFPYERKSRKGAFDTWN